MAKRSRQLLTRESLTVCLERIGYKVTNQSTDGTWRLLRLPDGTSTDYWIFEDRIEHKLGDSRGGSYFSYKECVLEADLETVAIVCKNSLHSRIFVQFHNFEAHRTEQTR